MQGFPGSVGPPDLAQLQSTMQAVEQASSGVMMHMNPGAAEATLLVFHQAPQPYQFCRFILENSQEANARFQAAGAIRDAALREWAFLTDENKKGLIIFCLRYVMEHSTAYDAFVQNKVSAVAAQLLKRGWLEFATVEKEAFFSEVKHAVLGVHGPEAQFSGLYFLESLVSEFSPSTSSPMGLPAEFHEQCGSLLEVDYLKKFYCWAQDAALHVYEKVVGRGVSVSEDKVCSAAFRLMFQIMNWDFKNANSSDSTHNSRIRHDTALLKKYERTLVQPGHTWYDVLISSGHIVWLLGLYGTLRKQFSCDVLWFDSPLAVSCRQLIVQFCSLTGTIFPSDNGQTEEKYLRHILSGIIQWIDPPAAVMEAIRCGQSESEVLDGCHALLSIATLTSTTTFDNLLKSPRQSGTIQFLSVLAYEVVKSLGATKEEEETWCSEALDILLETWNVILGRTDSGNSTLSTDGINACATLFSSLMDCHLKVAADSAFDDDNDSHFQPSISTRDERLSSYALIARAAAAATLPFLIRCFSERFSLLNQGKGRSDPTRTLEELYWLLLTSGHILTDSGQGETALVPEALLVRFPDVVEAAQHPVVVLSWSIINFVEKSLDPEMRGTFFSPRVMEAVVWFLARWAGTYLMPPESVRKHYPNLGREDKQLPVPQLSSNILLTFAGENNQGKVLLETFVRVSITALVSYKGETELQALTCHQLLPALVQRRNVCVHLVSLDSWRSLANAFANEGTLFLLTSRLQRSLAETLVRSASGIQDSNASNQYIRDLMGPMTTYLVDLSTKNDIRKVAQQPDAILLVTCFLERLRGAARATEPKTQKGIFDVAVAVMNPLLILLEIYKDEAAVIYMILKFAVDLVEGQVVFLDPGDTAVLVGFCMRLLQIYSTQNIRKISLSRSTGLLSEAKTDKYKDLRALLQLLTNLCSKDLVDFSSGSDGEERTDIGQIVYLGLHIVIPLMSSDLLKYPKLCYQYFSLLSHMLEVYPEKFVQLNKEAFEHIVGTLDWGIHQQDIEVVDMCLRAVNALATYHYKERIVGKEGLGVHVAGFRSPNEKSPEGILSRFLRMLIQLLLFEDFCMDLLGAAADTLFPLILCEQDLYQRLVHELRERQQSDVLKSRLDNAFKCLTSSNQLSPLLDRPNRQRFRKNLHKFFIDVSGFLRTK